MNGLILQLLWFLVLGRLPYGQFHHILLDWPFGKGDRPILDYNNLLPEFTYPKKYLAPKRVVSTSIQGVR